MKTGQFKSIAKKAAMTVAEGAVVTGGILLTTKFLDFNTLFKDQIAKDPAFADKWFVKYQAPIKLVAGAALATYVTNPWAKLAFFGLALNGAIGTVRLATSKADGTNFFQQVGNSKMIDQKLKEYAMNMNGPLSTRDQTYVAKPLSQRDQTYVAKPVDLMTPYYTNVGSPMMERGMGATMMERGTGCSMTM